MFEIYSLQNKQLFREVKSGQMSEEIILLYNNNMNKI